MTEALKGFIWKKLSDGPAHKYLVSFVIVSDAPIEGLVSEDSDNILMGSSYGLVDLLSVMRKYRPKRRLGSIEAAIRKVSHMTPEDLE